VNQELYKKYRPRKLSEMVGQENALSQLVTAGKRGVFPHAVLISGPSGCGKTTLARVFRKKLRCSDIDFREINTADFRGIDTARAIRRQMNMAPMGGKSRVWLIDECAKLTDDAQNGLLKTLEDTPSHVYFFLCTTDPGKLINTIINRCTHIQVRSLTDDELTGLIRNVVEREGKSALSGDVVEKLVRVAEGSPRKALVMLQSVLGESDEQRQVAIILESHPEKEAIEIARLLMNPKANWATMSRLLKAVPDLEKKAEGVRRLVLAFMSTAALGGNAKRACQVIECFAEPYYNTGKAGLVSSCYDAVSAR